MKDLKVYYTGGGFWNICFLSDKGEHTLWWCSDIPEEFGCKVYDLNPVSDEGWELLSDVDEDWKHTVRVMTDEEALEVLKKVYPVIAEIDKAVADEIAGGRI